MADDFMKKDVFDVHMQRIDQRFEDFKDVVDKTIDRMEIASEKHLAKHDSIAADMRLDNARLEGKIDSLAARLDTLQSRFAWNLAWAGIVMALVLALVQRLWN
ncbi:MAG: hypothetical protein IJR14_04770 [Synergistaceae bacterium]|nr:hypothetical protein [Synergistaceae bacterium]